MLKIISVPNKILSSPTKPVAVIDEKIKELLAEMEETLKLQTDPVGVGLSANQIGVNLSIFIVKKSPKAEIKVFINPKIIKFQSSIIKKPSPTFHHPPSRKKPVKLEGCLSIPRIWGPVNRTARIYLEYQDLAESINPERSRRIKRRWFSGFEAAIIQHEMDHLNGVVFTQRSLEQKKPIYKEVDGELELFEI
ncbi:peptide deformylase [Candidatus Roizmanbacteria bacterium CG_4_10_14_0_8_um_filter_35_28]|nr:MAG: peptide deformylase [Candidatus Roizmanbacteria bacterium CG_4_10_14_0_8_um_filter_35_28]PJC83684.1 MAG: peptide deformylase [Candidatus Roizmanbacteria bacterium CG_4_8_14_3_um_filter_35_14]PJE60934.1 MAG: peptide deformylase [Candidatus Roizmanbacteria bacterium CG10_big_fil_rev_8_21_14_0_10_36_26]